MLADSESITAGELFACYQAWAQRMGVRPFHRLNQKRFGQEIRKRFTVTAERHTVYQGIGLRPASEVDAENAVPLTPSDMVPASSGRAPISTH